MAAAMTQLLDDVGGRAQGHGILAPARVRDIRIIGAAEAPAGLARAPWAAWTAGTDGCSRGPLRRQNRTDMNVPTSLNPTLRYAAIAGALKSLTYKVTTGARVRRANATTAAIPRLA